MYNADRYLARHVNRMTAVKSTDEKALIASSRLTSHPSVIYVIIVVELALRLCAFMVTDGQRQSPKRYGVASLTD